MSPPQRAAVPRLPLTETPSRERKSWFASLLSNIACASPRKAKLRNGGSVLDQTRSVKTIQAFVRSRLARRRAQQLRVERRCAWRRQTGAIVFLERSASGEAGGAPPTAMGCNTSLSRSNAKWLSLNADPRDALRSLSRLLTSSSTDSLRAASRFCLLSGSDVERAGVVFKQLLEGVDRERSSKASVNAVIRLLASLQSNAQLAARGVSSSCHAATQELIMSILSHNINLVRKLFEAVNGSHWLNRRVIELIEGQVATLHAAPQPLAAHGALQHYELSSMSDGIGAVESLQLRIDVPEPVERNKRAMVRRASDLKGGRGAVAGATSAIADAAAAAAAAAVTAAATATTAAATATTAAATAAATGATGVTAIIMRAGQPETAAAPAAAAASDDRTANVEATPAAAASARTAPGCTTSNPADAYLRQHARCAPPAAEWLVETLPSWCKGLLPFEDDEDYVPEAVRERPQHWLKLSVDVTFHVTFGETADDNAHGQAHGEAGAATEAGGANGGGGRTRRANHQDIKALKLHLKGRGCWPTIGSVEVVFVRLKAHATMWWSVFDSRMLLALRKQEGAPRLSWDVEAFAGGCGLPLPDVLEDRVPAALLNAALEAFSCVNPLELNLAAKPTTAAQEQGAAAVKLQAASRGRQARRRPLWGWRAGGGTSPAGASPHDAKLCELEELQRELESLRRQQAALTSKADELSTQMGRLGTELAAAASARTTASSTSSSPRSHPTSPGRRGG